MQNTKKYVVYAISAESSPYEIKIGKTGNLHRRLKQLQTAHADKLIIRAYKEYPNKIAMDEAEKNYHAELINHHISGEWFYLSQYQLKRMFAKKTKDVKNVVLPDHSDNILPCLYVSFSPKIKTNHYLNPTTKYLNLQKPRILKKLAEKIWWDTDHPENNSIHFVSGATSDNVTVFTYKWEVLPLRIVSVNILSFLYKLCEKNMQCETKNAQFKNIHILENLVMAKKNN